MLDRVLELVAQICQEFGGINRFSAGDAHCLTFSDADRAMAATERLAQDWDLFDRREQLNCGMTAGAAQGNAVSLPILCPRHRPERRCRDRGQQPVTVTDWQRNLSDG